MWKKVNGVMKVLNTNLNVTLKATALINNVVTVSRIYLFAFGCFLRVNIGSKFSGPGLVYLVLSSVYLDYQYRFLKNTLASHDLEQMQGTRLLCPPINAAQQIVIILRCNAAILFTGC